MAKAASLIALVGLSMGSTMVGASTPVSSLRASSHDHLKVAVVEFPTYHIKAKIVPETLNRAGTVLQIPEDARQVGWFRLGSQPGEPGTSLMFGHRNQTAALWNVPSMKRGTPVTVTGLNGVVTKWKVTSVQTIDKRHPTPAMYNTEGPPRLALVTCGGPFNYATGHFVDNVIAWADLAVPPKR